MQKDKLLSAALLQIFKSWDILREDCQINVPRTFNPRNSNLSRDRYWLVEAGGEDYSDYKIARFDLYASGYYADGNTYYTALWKIPRWIKKEGWKICRMGDFDIYSMTCSPPRFVRQLNDSRQLRAVTITIKYNERSD